MLILAIINNYAFQFDVYWQLIEYYSSYLSISRIKIYIISTIILKSICYLIYTEMIICTVPLKSHIVIYYIIITSSNIRNDYLSLKTSNCLWALSGHNHGMEAKRNEQKEISTFGNPAKTFQINNEKYLKDVITAAGHNVDCSRV